jgi:hypothetical protein
MERLGDKEISDVMPEVFGDKPEVAAGLHYRQAAAVWQRWNPIFWLAIRFRRCLAEPAPDDAYLTLQVRQPKQRPLQRLRAFLSQTFTRKRPPAAAVVPARSDARP